jgi:hypothetical protein
MSNIFKKNTFPHIIKKSPQELIFYTYKNRAKNKVISEFSTLSTGLIITIGI